MVTSRYPHLNRAGNVGDYAHLHVRNISDELVGQLFLSQLDVIIDMRGGGVTTMREKEDAVAGEGRWVILSRSHSDKNGCDDRRVSRGTAGVEQKGKK